MTEISCEAIIKFVENGKIGVAVKQADACGSCAAQKLCHGEKEEKIIWINNPQEDYKVGEVVLISTDYKSCILSVVYGYILPLVLFLAVVFGLYAAEFDEIICGIFGIIILIPYYFGLSFVSRKIFSNNQFKITKKH